MSDGWSGYSWIGFPFSGYIHSVHNNDHGLNSTSHIEGIWSILKNIIKSMFIIPNENFILYLRESEFRRNINSLNNKNKWKELLDIFNYIYNRNLNIEYSEHYLFSLTKNNN